MHLTSDVLIYFFTSEQPERTKGRCIANCLIQYYKQHRDRWPPQVPALNSSLLFANYNSDQLGGGAGAIGEPSGATGRPEGAREAGAEGGGEARNESGTGDVRSQCDHRCDRGVACLQELYEPFVIREQQSLLPDLEQFDLHVFAPKYMIQFKYEPKTPMIHFLCYVGSTTNLWLGLSFLALLKYGWRRTAAWRRRRRALRRRRQLSKLGQHGQLTEESATAAGEALAFERAAASALRQSQYQTTYSQPGQFDAAW